MDAVTYTVQGTGGATFQMDVPPAGTHAHEAFVGRVASGDLVVLDDDGDPIDRVALAAELMSGSEDDGTAALDLDKATVKELRAFAEDHDIDLGEAHKKAEILEVIRAADADD